MVINTLRRASLLLVISLFLTFTANAETVRIKDITRFEGERGNQLIGYGLVVGLSGTGDSRNSLFTNQSLANMLQLLGITVDPHQIRSRNVAGVIVTAELPPFIRPGETIDVSVSSLGDSETLQGGVLLVTPLKAVDGKVYAVAQGPLSIGGFAAGGGGAQVQRNHPTVGMIPNGGIVERTVDTRFYDPTRGTITLLLQNPDFVTATRIAQAISNEIGGRRTRALDANRIEITIPDQYLHRVSSLMALIGEIPVTPDVPARVVVNERTGTVVIGGNVRILPVALSHGDLTVTIQTRFLVSQPPPFSPGETVVVPETQVEVVEEEVGLSRIEGTTTIDDLVMSLNALGVGPRDLIAILQALNKAGALQGELIVE
ncbi:MAG TPA: flagellar basal body P-ring protein FlgI [Atribacteraceae bacterium]|nr:flagellar basal body P-ring protein FlgI [Atribacteraceae bacterium]